MFDETAAFEEFVLVDGNKGELWEKLGEFWLFSWGEHEWIGAFLLVAHSTNLILYEILPINYI